MLTPPNPPSPSPSPASPQPPSAQPSAQLQAELSGYVEEYRRRGDLGVLMDQLRALAKRTAPGPLAAAAEPFRQLPEVVMPLYESIVASAPNDAQALVVLANAYWLTGRGPEIVGDLARRAIAIDPDNRGAWHLWALAEPSVRGRVDRWRDVAARFPADQLARAALADNAVSLAHDEHDPQALDLAIATYQTLLAEATNASQRLALENTLATLEKWRV